MIGPLAPRQDDLAGDLGDRWAFWIALCLGAPVVILRAIGVF